jgi:hypothetical protein
MASTFYKYAERSADSQINWAEVGRNVTDMLREEVQIREEKKTAIDEASREMLQTLQNSPQGSNVELGTWTIGFADNAVQTLLMQDRLLKSGQLKLKDYLTVRQNLNDNSNQMFDIAANLQNIYKTQMDKVDSGEASIAVLRLMEDFESVAKFQGTAPIINPVTGQVNIAKKKMKMGPDGKEVEYVDENDIMSVQQLKNIANSTINMFKTEERVAKLTSNLGTEVQSMVTGKIGRGLYQISKETNITLREMADGVPIPGASAEEQKMVNTYFEWERKSVESAVTNQKDRASILVDKLGYDAQKATPENIEKAKEDSNILLYEYDGAGNPIFQFTEEQDNAARDYIRDEIRMSLEIKKEIDTAVEQAPQQPSVDYLKWMKGQGDEKQQLKDFGNMLGKLYSGDNDEIEAALQYLGGMPGISDVDRTGDGGVVVTDDEGNTKKFSFKSQDGKTVMEFNDFVKSIGNYFFGKNVSLKDISEGAEEGRGGREFQPYSYGVFTTQKQQISPDFEKAVRSKIPKNLIVPGDETTTVKNLNLAISSIPGMEGYTVVEAWGGKDAFTIQDKDEVPILKDILIPKGMSDAEKDDIINAIIGAAAKTTKIGEKAIAGQEPYQAELATARSSRLDAAKQQRDAAEKAGLLKKRTTKQTAPTQ